jgi:glycosyltransferase involved in cell wall biosynthesis
VTDVAPGLRIAAFEDSAYRRHDDVVYADRAFLTFLAGLGHQFDGIVLLGRLDPTPGRSHYPLPEDVRFVGLPHYPDLTHPILVARGLARSARRFWSVLADVDAAFLLGPSPMALVFAVLALVRGRRVVLGVRQNTALYVRKRHPGRRVIHLAADTLEGIWRLLSRRCPVVVVGPDIAVRYRSAPLRHDLRVSLMHERDIAPAAVAEQRSYAGELLVLSVGRLDEEKNPLMLADVLARLRAAEGRHRLIVCGEGPMASDLSARLRLLGVEEHAELRGYVPLDSLIDLYRRCHALLHVSWTEGLPQVLYEAFAARLPIVATDVGGITAGVGDAAVLVPPGDPRAAADAVRRVTGNAGLREQLITAGLSLIRMHTYEAEQRRLAEFIRNPASPPAPLEPAQRSRSE